MLLHVHLRADEAHLLLAGAALVVRVCDQLRVMLLFGEVGVRANGSGEVGRRGVVDEAR